MANTKVKAEQLEAAQTNITSLGTLTALTVDDITIDGSTISDGGDLTIDVTGNLILDADGGEFKFQDGGTDFARIFQSSGNFYLNVPTQDTDLIIQGNDGGSNVSALTFDMSEGGNAVFGKNVSINAAGASSPAPLQAFQVILHSGGGRRGTIYYNSNSRIAFAALNASNTWESMEIEAADINFNTGGTSQTTALTLNSSQNAGLSVTPKSWNSNFKALQIGPWGSLATTTSGNGESFRVNANFYNDGSAEKYLGTGYALMFKEGVTAGSFVFSSSQASGSADGSIASWYHSELHNHSWAATLETTTSDGSDNYGVGLDSGGGAGSAARGAGLWVYGNEHSSNPGHLIAQMGSSGAFKVMTGASGDERLQIDSGGVQNFRQQTAGYGDWRFGFAGSGSSYGYVGSWSTTFGNRIHLRTGSSGAIGVTTFSSSATNNFRIMQNIYYASGTYKAATTGRGTIFEQDNGAFYWVGSDSQSAGNTLGMDTLMYLQTDSGNLYIDGSLTQNYSFSDINLKTDIEELPSVTENLKKFRAVEFNWKDEKKRRNNKELGVIAQELEKVYPILVEEREKPAGENDKAEKLPPEKHLYVDYSKLTVVLLKAIQEQQTQIEELQEEVKALKGS